MSERIRVTQVPRDFKTLDEANAYFRVLVRDLERIVIPDATAGAGGSGLTVEEIEDLIGGNVIAGDGASISYNDATGKVTISTEDALPYDTLVDESGSYTYVGKAVAGGAEASPVWRIFRLDETLSPDTELRYADGVSTFTKIWNNRASYTY
jgi:hypothetical protein